MKMSKCACSRSEEINSTRYRNWQKLYLLHNISETASDQTGNKWEEMSIFIRKQLNHTKKHGGAIWNQKWFFRVMP